VAGNSMLVEFTLTPRATSGPVFECRKRPRAARLARRGEAALCRRAPGRVGRVPGPPRQRAREAPIGMTAQADDELWSAIADPSRRRVLDLLVSNGEVSASWLAGHVPFSRQAVSKHLVVLEQAGLVSRRKQGREVLYQVEADRLDQATRAMADLAAQWDRRLATIKRLAEAAHAEAKKKQALTGIVAHRTPRRTVMKDESANLGGRTTGATNAPGLPAAVDRATFRPNWTGCGSGRRRTPGKATRSPRPGGACPWSRSTPASR
jgi:DNA-binding transcriptional ArsR family regulator